MIWTHAATLALALLALGVAIVDARTRRIPDLLNAALLAAGLAATWALERDMLAALIGAAAGYAALAGLNWAYRRARGRDGIGLGDAKFLAGAGAWLGWMGLPFVVLIASALGLAWVGLQRLHGRRIERHDAIAFGPLLAAATFMVWLVDVYR
jgi:prepilin signal peptidase PulO-like enzyme (type II secretory pathway)